ncbi:MAG: cation transporter [Armatimonadetes bacterium]|nr:cation transporter [Armatimonadota bacterium]
MKGILAAIGAVLSAVLASLCCIVPLLLASVGMTGAGTVSALERFRPLFLLLAVTLLAFSFIKVYRKAPGCCAPDPRKIRAQKISLWITSALVLSLLFLPYMSAGPRNAQVSADTADRVIIVQVEGMKAPCCEIIVTKAIQKVPGVKALKVSSLEKKAVVQGTEKLDAKQLVDAINKTGYRASSYKEDGGKR